MAALFIWSSKLYRQEVGVPLQIHDLGKTLTGAGSLAYFELRSMLARMLWNFEMELCEGNGNWEDQKLQFVLVKPPLMVKLSHRKTVQ